MLDTNMVQYVRNKNERVLNRYREHFEQTVVSGIVVEEIVILGFGAAMDTARSAKSLADIDRLYADFLLALRDLREFDMRPYTQEAETIYRSFKRGKGSAKVKPMDGRIAAHAVSLGAVLVTGNLADFTTIPGLAVENWT